MSDRASESGNVTVERLKLGGRRSKNVTNGRPESNIRKISISPDGYPSVSMPKGQLETFLKQLGLVLNAEIYLEGDYNPLLKEIRFRVMSPEEVPERNQRGKG